MFSFNYSVRHVSNIQVFILKRTCTCSCMVLLLCCNYNKRQCAVQRT